MRDRREIAVRVIVIVLDRSQRRNAGKLIGAGCHGEIRCEAVDVLRRDVAVRS